MEVCIVQYICNDFNTIINLSRVNKNFHGICVQDWVWKQLCINKFTWLKLILVELEHKRQILNILPAHDEIFNIKIFPTEYEIIQPLVNNKKEIWKCLYFRLTSNTKKLYNNFKNGHYTYVGKIISNSLLTYLSTFKWSKRDGLGYQYDEYTSGLFSGKHQHYIGYWNDNKCNGYGIMIYEGRIYIGMWKNNNPDGIGILICDGYIYRGSFVMGKLTGIGIIIGKDHRYQGPILDHNYKDKNIEFPAFTVIKGKFNSGVLIEIL